MKVIECRLWGVECRMTRLGSPPPPRGGGVITSGGGARRLGCRAVVASSVVATAWLGKAGFQLPPPLPSNQLRTRSTRSCCWRSGTRGETTPGSLRTMIQMAAAVRITEMIAIRASGLENTSWTITTLASDLRCDTSVAYFKRRCGKSSARDYTSHLPFAVVSTSAASLVAKVGATRVNTDISSSTLR